MKAAVKLLRTPSHSRRHLLFVGFLFAAASIPGCGTRQPPEAPADAPNDEAETAPPGSTGAPYVPADAQFMRDMLVHHAQALEMTELVPGRSESEAIALLARRIEETQHYEIGLMRDWLEERDEPVPEPGEALGPHGGHGAGHGGMAGMASPEEMADLAEASGVGFDRLFLELMIRHHEGALVMLDELAEYDGSGQEPELFTLISHIDADQRAEIARMRRMLDTIERAGERG